MVLCSVHSRLAIPGPMASTVLPVSNCANWSGVRLALERVPAGPTASGHSMSSGATAATTASAGAGTAAVTRPAPDRNAARDVIDGSTPALSSYLVQFVLLSAHLSQGLSGLFRLPRLVLDRPEYPCRKARLARRSLNRLRQ